MPTPKAPLPYHIGLSIPPPQSIRITPLIRMRPKKLECLSRAQIKDYRQRLRHAVGFYMGRCNPISYAQSTQALTLTEQNKKLRSISNAAKNLAKALRNRKPHKAMLKKLKKVTEIHYIDFSTQAVVTRHLHHIGIQLYKDFLDRIWDGRLAYGYCQEAGQMVKIDKSSFYAFADSLLPLLEHVATLKNYQETGMPRYAIPDLHFLLTKFMIPLWVEITERTYRHGNNKEIPYYFYNWLQETLKKAHCSKGLSIDRVKKIARHFYDAHKIRK